MPEGPEVERARRMVHDTFLDARIIHVQTIPDDIVFDGCDPAQFEKELINKQLLDTVRKGKLLYLVLDQPPFPLLHLGMTGSVLIKGQEAPKFADFKSDDKNWPPRFWKLVLDFDNGESMAFTDCRRLGRVRLQQDPLNESPMKDLGFDPITETIPFQEFQSRIAMKACPIKSLLLDQSFSAGVGNWIADEILYQSAIHPSSKCNTLTHEEISLLYDKMHFIVRKAVEWNADSDKFPQDWLFHYRWRKGSKEQPKMPNGNSVVFETVGGRTSAIVPAVQIMKSTGPKPTKKQKEPIGGETSAITPVKPKRAPSVDSKEIIKSRSKKQKQTQSPTRRSARITSKYFSS